MASSKHNLIVDINSRFDVSFEFFNDDNTPYSFEGFDVMFIVRDVNSVKSNITLEVDSIIVIENKISIIIGSETTKYIENSRAYYNLIIEGSYEKIRILEGDVDFTGTLDEN